MNEECRRKNEELRMNNGEPWCSSLFQLVETNCSIT